MKNYCLALMTIMSMNSFAQVSDTVGNGPGNNGLPGNTRNRFVWSPEVAKLKVTLKTVDIKKTYHAKAIYGGELLRQGTIHPSYEFSDCQLFLNDREYPCVAKSIHTSVRGGSKAANRVIQLRPEVFEQVLKDFYQDVGTTKAVPENKNDNLKTIYTYHPSKGPFEKSYVVADNLKLNNSTTVYFGPDCGPSLLKPVKSLLGYRCQPEEIGDGNIIY